MTTEQEQKAVAQPRDQVTLTLDTAALLWVLFLGCLIIELSLVYLDLAVNWQRGSEVGAIRRLFNITREDGLASLFAVTQTFAVALFAWLIFAVTRQTDRRRSVQWGWLVLSLFFTYMAIDDGAAVHERLGTAADDVADKSVGWFPSYTWQLVVLPFFALMGLFILYFLWRQLPDPNSRIRLIAAMACLGLAVALDFVEGLENGYHWLTQQSGWRTQTIAHFSKSLEEFLEMFAMTLLLLNFVAHLSNLTQRLTFHFQRG